MGRTAKLEQQARTKARQRRIAMDYDRATRDKRVKVGGVAQLCDLSVGEVQRLRRAAQEAKDSRGNVDPAGPNPVGSPEVTLRPLGDAPVRHCGSEETRRSHEQPVDVARAR